MTQTAEQVIGHTLTVWLFLGLSFIKLGIGFAIATIVRNLRATGRGILDNYGASRFVDVGTVRRGEIRGSVACSPGSCSPESW